MSAILETSQLSKRFGGLQAIDNLNLVIEAGELRCLIGPNGAGKSTLFKLIMGVYPPSEGAVLFNNENINRLHSHRRVKQGLSIKFQAPGIFTDLAVRQNLHIALQSHRQQDELYAEIERLLTLLDLAAQADQPAATLSHGQQQWLEIGMALGPGPQVLLLDEPTAGMSPEETIKTGELVKRLNADGMAIVVIEHDMAFVRQIANRVTVLHYGSVFAEGPLDDIIANDDVARIYLGKV